MILTYSAARATANNMQAITDKGKGNGLDIILNDTALTLLPEGALWWPARRLLVLSDLHFEKGSSYAAHGQMLPPYDTAVTLSMVEALVARWQPDICLSLGDSFHDAASEARLGDAAHARIKALTNATDWVWVEGNHDPDPPASLGGRAAKTVTLGALIFRHEPTGEQGEIAGHLHPVAKVSARGRSVRKKCFACDDTRLIMPALGALTGGLNVLHPAFNALFPSGLTTHAIGRDRLYTLAPKRLVSDTAYKR